MKKITVLLGVLLSLIVVSSIPAGAQTTVVSSISSESKVDSESVAWALLHSFADKYEMVVEYLDPVRQEEYHRMVLLAGKDLLFTNLTVNGTNVPLSRPLRGFPLGTNGYLKWVSVSITSFDSSGQYRAGGGSWFPRVDESTPVTVEIHVGWRFQIVKPTLPEVPGAQWALDYSGGSAPYNSSYAGFGLWLNPEVGRTEYRLVDKRTGIVYLVGTVSLSEDSVTTDHKPVNVLMAGRVVEIDLNDIWYYRGENVTLDGSVERNGTPVPAKVYTMRHYGDWDTRISVQSGLGLTVEFNEWKNGRLIPFTVAEVSNEYWTQWIVPNSKRAVIATVRSRNGATVTPFTVVMEPDWGKG